MEAFEYKRAEQGVTPMWTSIRFPGQQYDEETDAYENWHRYYYPIIGRYLSPEPLFHNPNWVKAEAGSGLAAPTYAYARNNPIRYTDPTGLCVSTYDCCLARNPGNPGACGGFTGPRPFELPPFDPKKILLKPVTKFIQDVCKIVAVSAAVKCVRVEISLGDGCFYDCGGQRRYIPGNIGGGGSEFCPDEPTIDQTYPVP